MPVGEFAGEVVGGLFRLIGQFIVEVVGEILVRGVGYAIWGRVSPGADPDGWPSAVVGLLFWAAAAALGYVAYLHAVEWLAVDRCLDSGGSYHHQAESCLHG